MTISLRTWILTLTLLMTLSLPQTSQAQGGLIVFDPINFIKNSITAAQMIKQIELMLRNLIRNGGTWEDTARLLRLLDEVLATGEALHYQLPDLDQQMRERFPGYVAPPLWVTAYDHWTQTSLDTLRGTLDTVHEQLRPAQQAREDALLAALHRKSDGAAGNLDATQAGNMFLGQVVEEQRKIRQLLGAQMNAQNVAQAHALTTNAAAERIMQDWFERGAAAVTIRPMTGGGGFSGD
jgi:type IV secretion system protein TrbJ